jgi:hypothetical protein
MAAALSHSGRSSASGRIGRSTPIPRTPAGRTLADSTPAGRSLIYWTCHRVPVPSRSRGLPSRCRSTLGSSRAEHAQDSKQRKDFLDIERTWLALASNLEDVERLTEFKRKPSETLARGKARAPCCSAFALRSSYVPRGIIHRWITLRVGARSKAFESRLLDRPNPPKLMSASLRKRPTCCTASIPPLRADSRLVTQSHLALGAPNIATSSDEPISIAAVTTHSGERNSNAIRARK